MNKLLWRSKSFLKRNSSTILTCIGGAGVVATSVLAVKATPKALLLLDEAKQEKGEELTKLEIVKVAGPAYIPAIITGVSTIACIFGANALNKRQQASLMSAYALLNAKYNDYKNKVGELYGDDADRTVRTELAKDNYEENDISVDDGKILFYDEFSERYFESTMETVIKAEYEINKKMTLWGGAYVNEFYEHLDIPPIDQGDEMGWNHEYLMQSIWSKWLEFEHTKVVMDDGLECYIISFGHDPMFDFEFY